MPKGLSGMVAGVPGIPLAQAWVPLGSADMWKAAVLDEAEMDAPVVGLTL